MEIQPITSKAHRLSEQYSIDPAYSAKAGDGSIETCEGPCSVRYDTSQKR